MSNVVGNIRSAWNELIGDVHEFSMENRAFNYVCIITFPILIFCLLFDICIAQITMSYVLSGLIVVLAVLYHFSRYKKIYQTGIVIYAILSYLTLILNYYSNSGIIGPSIMLFFLTFQLLIAIGKPKQFILWITLHICIVAGLLYSEYTNPALVPGTYLSKQAWFLDVFSTFVVALAFIFSVTIYLRRSFNGERVLAKERALAILKQNKQITEQNHQLEKVNDEKNKLFSIVSHDLKAPLDSIRGYLVLLSENLLSEEEKHRVESELLEQTNYTSDLLLNLLSWAKTQMHGVKINLVPVYLKDMVEEASSHKVGQALKKGVKLTYSINPDIEVVCDKDMMHIVLRNLLNNAIKFTEQGGEVYLKAREQGNRVELSVSDTGIGIPMEKHNELFTLKTSSTYGTNNEKGTGLGLMMCKEFMTHQHGDIWFDSKVGEGSVFYITLPLTQL